MECNATEFPIPEILSLLELAPLLVGISTVCMYLKRFQIIFPLNIKNSNNIILFYNI